MRAGIEVKSPVEKFAAFSQRRLIYVLLRLKRPSGPLRSPEGMMVKTG